jgi:hypothetical protein
MTKKNSSFREEPGDIKVKYIKQGPGGPSDISSKTLTIIPGGGLSETLNIYDIVKSLEEQGII